MTDENQHSKHKNLLNNQKQKTMNNLLYLVALILVIGWAVGVFAYSAGGLIHILLVIALIAVIFRVISGRKIVD